MQNSSLKTPDKSLVQFSCKACAAVTSGAELVQGHCPACGAELSDDVGLFDFRTRDEDYYFVDVPRSEIDELLQVLKEQGWREALREVERKYGATKPNLVKLMVDSSRAAWVYLTRPAAFENALEIGCGWGSAVPTLASQFDNVFAVDLTRERIRFAQLRCLEMGIKNASFGIGFDSPNLPFAAETFDLVAMNGVLAYTPLLFPGNPRAAQLEFLREVCRTVRPGGVIYVGSQNRFGWQYLLGARDHSDLKWTSVMPQRVANMYCKMRTGAEYSTPIYTANGYRKLLKEAGFGEVEVYWPHHSYESFRMITSLDKKGANFMLSTTLKWSEGGGLRRMFVRPANFFGLFTPFVPSFSIVGRK